MKRFDKKQTETCHPELVSESEVGESTPLSNSLPRREERNAFPRPLRERVSVGRVRGQRAAFTLAEVLITLGIIGVVAALTMPSLIANHQKHIVETKLKRFYSNINQAFRLSEIDNGDKENWINEFKSICGGGDNSPDLFTEKCLVTIYNKYLKNYIKVTKTEYTSEIWGGSYLLYFADGSIVAMSYRGHDYLYFIDSNALKHTKVGKNMFPFGFYGSMLVMPRGKEFMNKGVEPYISDGYNGTREFLKTTSPSNGAKLIQLNGWKIPDDYPFWD